jgi:hypothetical protein
MNASGNTPTPMKIAMPRATLPSVSAIMPMTYSQASAAMIIPCPAPLTPA